MVVKAALERCQNIVGYRFRENEILRQALTHASCALEAGDNNERLEFLGDAILSMIISEYLFTNFPEIREGELTQIKSFVVSRSVLAKKARGMGLRECLLLGKGIAQRERLPESVYANAFEALIAGIYLDGGIDIVRDFIINALNDEIDAVLAKTHMPNYKSILQEYTQKEMHTTPTYRVIEERGPDHGKVFKIIAKINGKVFSPGTGLTKKQAEQHAAQKALHELGIDPVTYLSNNSRKTKNNGS